MGSRVEALTLTVAGGGEAGDFRSPCAVKHVAKSPAGPPKRERRLCASPCRNENAPAECIHKPQQTGGDYESGYQRQEIRHELSRPDRRGRSGRLSSSRISCR